MFEKGNEVLVLEIVEKIGDFEVEKVEYEEVLVGFSNYIV